MSPEAIIMMVIALCTVWGGLVAALVHLRAHPDSSHLDEE